MIYLLDTDGLIFMLRGLKPSVKKPAQRQRALKVVAECRQAQAAGHEVGLSAITVAELEYGARRSRDYAAEMAAVRKILIPFEVFDFDGLDSPVHYGMIRHALEAVGTPLGAMDLLIAAHALRLAATLVTNNQVHFRRVPGLKTVNWS